MSLDASRTPRSLRWPGGRDGRRDSVAAVRVVIAGGHGQIALRLTALLAGRGDLVTGVVRNPDHRGDVEAAGGTALVFDLEAGTATDLAEHLVGADAVVFAAGAGPTSGAPRKDTVDRAAAGAARRRRGARRGAALRAGVGDRRRRGAGRVPRRGVGRLPARQAGRRGGAARHDTGLDDPAPRARSPTTRASGRCCSRRPSRTGSVTRDDMAAVLAALLDSPGTIGQTLELVEGDDDVLAAVAAIALPPSRDDDGRRTRHRLTPGHRGGRPGRGGPACLT